jgi:5-methylcytosine-specific restriction endonuclease McrA
VNIIVGMETRICNKCCLELPLTMFSRAKLGKYGRTAVCKACHWKWLKEWRKTDQGKATMLKNNAAYRNSEKGKAHRAEYLKSEKMKLARMRWKESEAGKAYEKRYAQSEKRKAVVRRYEASEKGLACIRRGCQTELGKARLARGTHKRRSAMQNCISTLTAAEWKAIKAAQKNRCYYCHRKVKTLTMDHVIPLSKGGNHVKENIVAACLHCNCKKNNKIVTLF